MSPDKKFSVLIADESRSLLINLKEILKNKFPCEQIVPCRDGAEAWKNIQKSNFVLILSDSVLPGISGEELLSNVRENGETKNIPFLIISNKKDKESVMKAISSGATGYMIKPFSENDIIKKLKASFIP
jgi:two-component system chemotaxis response regulator CheY